MGREYPGFSLSTAQALQSCPGAARDWFPFLDLPASGNCAYSYPLLPTRLALTILSLSTCPDSRVICLQRLHNVEVANEVKTAPRPAAHLLSNLATFESGHSAGLPGGGLNDAVRLFAVILARSCTSPAVSIIIAELSAAPSIVLPLYTPAPSTER